MRGYSNNRYLAVGTVGEEEAACTRRYNASTPHSHGAGDISEGFSFA